MCLCDAAAPAAFLLCGSAACGHTPALLSALQRSICHLLEASGSSSGPAAGEHVVEALCLQRGAQCAQRLVQCSALKLDDLTRVLQAALGSSVRTSLPYFFHARTPHAVCWSATPDLTCSLHSQLVSVLKVLERFDTL